MVEIIKEGKILRRKWKYNDIRIYEMLMLGNKINFRVSQKNYKSDFNYAILIVDNAYLCLGHEHKYPCVRNRFNWE